MAVHKLTIESSYQSAEWTIMDAYREVVANALDAKALGLSDALVKVSRKGVRVSSPHAILPINVLLLGQSGSRQHTACIGTFGEGLPMALLVLARAVDAGDLEHVRVTNGAESWLPELRWCDDWGAQILYIRTRSLPSVSPDATGFVVEFGPLSPAQVAQFKSMFLALDTALKPAQTVTAPHLGKVLLGREYQGRLYVKGVLIQTRPDTVFGYNLLNLELNRDRKFVDDWRLRWEIDRVLESAVDVTQGRQRKQLLTGIKVGLESSKFLEGSSGYFRSSRAVPAALAEEFRRQHGEEAVPAENMSQSMQLEHRGVRAPVVSRKLREVLTAELQPAAERLDELRTTPVRLFGWAELTSDEQIALIWACDTLTAALRSDVPVQELVVVGEFADNAMAGTCQPGADTPITLARVVLADRLQTLCTLIHEHAHLGGGTDGSAEHVQAMERLHLHVLRLLAG